MVGALALLAGALGFALLPDAPVASGPREEVPAASTLESAPAGNGPRALPAPGPGAGLALVATLLPAEGAPPVQGQVGEARVSDEDRAQWEEVRREGGRGPASVLELANVARWQDAPLAPGEGGSTRLGPVPVAPAPRYRLLAWAEDGTAWQGDLVAPDAPAGTLDFGALRPVSPTGVRVLLVGRVREGFRVRLTRAPRDEADAERAAASLPLVRAVRPALARALEGEGALPLGDGAVLAPLPPDAAVRLTVVAPTGREAEALTVPLREGRVEDVRLDLERLFPGGEGRLVALDGRVVLGEGTRPLPAGARLERLFPAGADVPLPPDGRFRLGGLPGWAPSRFALHLPAPRDGRPPGPGRWELDLDPQGAEERVARTWRVPAYGWLVLALDANARTLLHTDARRPYPVYLLERQDERGAWRVEPGDAFLEEEDGVAVSLTRPGVYRVVAASSPLDRMESAPVRVERVEGERVVRLGARADGRTCRVVVTRDGRPVSGARVFAGGTRGSLPPLRGTTDAQGVFALGAVRGDGPVRLEVERDEAPPLALDGTEACRTRGEVAVAL